ncbi:ParA family protein [Flagellimonas flava]|uniref:ParA family protein n=1 Tax=Flagellimonas flava TaxID=570519 RepID=UPI003D6600CB
MRILIGNQKGGVGKSTLSILFCNYLSLVKKKNVVAIDLDFQRSFLNQWETENEVMDGEPPYKVIGYDLNKAVTLLDGIKDDYEHDYVIDSPGNLDNPDILNILSHVDCILIPFSYEKKAFESTMVYARVAKHINKEAPIVFVANRVKKTAKVETKEKVDIELSIYGEIAPVKIYDRVDMDRLTTRGLSKIQMEVFDGFFNYFFPKYLITI